MATLHKRTGSVEPNILTVKKDKNNNIVYAAVNNNIVNNEDNTWSWDELELPDYALYNIHVAEDDIKYKVFVAHIIKAYYDANDETAVLSNYLSDPENEKYKIEFDDLQKIRKTAKTISRYIVSNKLF